MKRKSSCAITLFFSVTMVIAFSGCSPQGNDTTSMATSPMHHGSERQSAETATAKSNGATGGAPRIVLDRTTCDVGQIRPTSRNTAVFRLTNAGKAELRIIHVRQCCGIAVKVDKKEVVPGETCVLTVECLAPSGPGVLSKNIALFTNDPGELKVSGTFSALRVGS